MELRFDGRVAVVTGAGRGLGRAYAHLLAARGASVVVNDLGVTTQGAPSHEDRAGTVAAEITAAGGDAVPNRDTVATPEGGQALIGTALDAYGRIDILVNNAGPQGGGLFDTVTDEQIDTLLRPHLHGAFHVTRPAWRAMCEQGYGRVVMTSSQAVLGIPGSGPYSAAKGGIVGLTNTLALEGARHGIRVNAVLPTAGTPGNAGIRNPVFRAWLAQMRPEHVAPVVAFLAHESCPWNGEKIITGGGRVSRLFLASTRGVFYNNPTPEDIAASVETIADETGYAVSRSAMDDMSLWAEHLPWPDPNAPMSIY